MARFRDRQASDRKACGRCGPCAFLVSAKNAPVAQLDRAPDYESGGQEFESLRARHFGTRLGMVASDSFAEFLQEQLAVLGRITMRRMFGKTGVFCDGFMLGMVTNNTLYLRVDDDNRPTFKEAECFPPLNYEKNGAIIDLSFWRAPERLFDEPNELVTWARLALAAARRVAAQRERTTARRNRAL